MFAKLYKVSRRARFHIKTTEAQHSGVTCCNSKWQSGATAAPKAQTSQLRCRTRLVVRRAA